MVFERLFSFKLLQEATTKNYASGIILGLIGILFSIPFMYDNNFPNGLLTVFFTAILAIPYIQYTIIKEEKTEITKIKELTLFKHHLKPIKNILLLLLGIVTAYFTFNLLAPSFIAKTMFESQHYAMTSIKQLTTGFFINPNEIFSTIFLNNLRVLITIFLTSLAFGAGAIFILTWNASILGVALSDYAYNTYITLISNGSNIFETILITTFKLVAGYGIHGGLEVLAYITVALTGGILSAYLTNHHYNKRRTNEIVIEDISILLITSILLLVLSAFVEVFVSSAIL